MEEDSKGLGVAVEQVGGGGGQVWRGGGQGCLTCTFSVAS